MGRGLNFMILMESTRCMKTHGGKCGHECEGVRGR
jgi:hypothetical protein